MKVVDIHADLVERCRQGQQEAYAQLYQAYAKAMYNTALRIVQHTQEAEDVLQEGFVDAFKRLESFRGESTFGAWLKRIIINKSLNVVKKKKIEFADVEGVYEEVEEDMEEEGEEYSIQMIKRAVETLPEGYKVIFSLYAFEGMSHKEIAEELSISESTSKSQYSRAKRNVKQFILAHHGA